MSNLSSQDPRDHVVDNSEEESITSKVSDNENAPVSQFVHYPVPQLVRDPALMQTVEPNRPTVLRPLEPEEALEFSNATPDIVNKVQYWDSYNLASSVSGPMRKKNDSGAKSLETSSHTRATYTNSKSRNSVDNYSFSSLM